MSTKTLNYIIAQTRQNISLLQELERVSRQDADLILSKLPLPSGSPHAFIARAKFNYNEDGKDMECLSFSAGDMIEVLDESNNWWRGRHRGREGVFPSFCVERVTNGASQFSPPQAVPSYSQIPPHMAPPPFSPCPPGLSPYHGPPLAPYPPYNGPPPPHHGPPPVILQSNQPDNKKPGPFGGGLGNTLAHSAVGGVGLGAGSALASNIVNHLF